MPKKRLQKHHRQVINKLTEVEEPNGGCYLGCEFIKGGHLQTRWGLPDNRVVTLTHGGSPTSGDRMVMYALAELKRALERKV